MVAGCGATCVKYLFFTFNFLVFLCGGAVLGLALWARLDNNFNSTINRALGDNVPGPGEMQNLHIVLYVMMGIGGALILCGGLGCLGACCESPCLLGTFFAIILVLFLAEIAGAIYIFVRKDAIREDMGKWYKEHVIDNYNKNEDIKKLVDETQRNLECCGSNGCVDYGGNAPSSCGDNCMSRQGCFVKMYNRFRDNITVVAIVLACLVAIELLAMIFSCILCSSMRYG